MAFHDRRSQHAGLAKRLQSDAGSDNIDDRIDCPDLMKMDLVRLIAMDFPFGDRDTMEHGNGFTLYPIRERATGNELSDFGKTAGVGVFMMFVVLRIRCCLVMLM